jgi:hypothetical protein
MPIQLPYNFDSLDINQLSNAFDNAGDIIGKSVPGQYLDENFSKLAQIIHVGATSPTASYDGQFWLDTSKDPAVLYVLKNSIWQPVNWIYINSTAPISPSMGQFWLDTSVSPPVIKVYDGSTWQSNIDKLSGFSASQTPTANTIPVAGSTGKLDAGWLPSSGGGGGGDGVPNGSFEIDSDADDIPDSWSRSLYPGGSGGFETTNPAHGAKAYRFTHPGGAGNGGGYLESEYIEISELERYVLFFIHWASNAGMKNIVRVRYFDRGKVFLSSVDVYSSTNNPTSPTLFVSSSFAPPSTARYIKIQLIGGFTDTNVAGTAYFDRVSLSKYSNACIAVNKVDNTERETNSTSYVDTATQFTLYEVPSGIQISFSSELCVSAQNGTAYQRWRIGTAYSNEVSTSSTNFAAYHFKLTSNSSGTLTLIMQLKSSNAAFHAYGRKSPLGIFFEPV